MSILWWVVPSLLTGILIYLVLAHRKKRRNILSEIDLVETDLISFDGAVYRFLGANHRYIFVEDFYGNVVEKAFKQIKHIDKPDKTLVFYFQPTKDYDMLYQKITKNPFVPARAIAICEESIAGTDDRRLRLCIKDVKDFRKIKQFLQYLQSHIQ